MHIFCFADCINNTFLALRASNSRDGDVLFSDFFLTGMYMYVFVLAHRVSIDYNVGQW